VGKEQNPLVSELDVLHAYDPLGGFTFPGIWKQKKIPIKLEERTVM